MTSQACRGNCGDFVDTFVSAYGHEAGAGSVEVLPRRPAAGAERGSLEPGHASLPGLAGRQLAAGIGGQAPAHDYLCCSAGKWVLEPRGSLTDGEAPLCHSGRDKGACGIARLFSFKQIPIGGSDTGLSARDN